LEFLAAYDVDVSFGLNTREKRAEYNSFNYHDKISARFQKSPDISGEIPGIFGMNFNP